MPEPANNGIVSIESRHSVEATLEKLTSILETHGVKIFALIDHSGEAEKAGMRMRNTKLLIFGNPKAGTPLMLAAPTAALDLPLKILVWEDAGGKVWLTYNSVEFIRQRHNLPPDLAANIAVIDTLAAKASQ
jgi:uncharacterized protein (DUF302 family)